MKTKCDNKVDYKVDPNITSDLLSLDHLIALSCISKSAWLLSLPLFNY